MMGVCALDYIESCISNASCCGHLQCVSVFTARVKWARQKQVLREPVWSLRVTDLSKDVEESKQRMPVLSPPFLTFH